MLGKIHKYLDYEGKMGKEFFHEDIDKIASVEFIPWEKLCEKTILITGATGLIGTSVVKGLFIANQKRNLRLKIIALVRDVKKAEERFADVLSSDVLGLKNGTVEDLPQFDEPIDYIIHGASQTASREFIDHGVETIRTSVLGTMNLLQLAKEKSVDGFVYLSSMEVYGYPKKGHKVKEFEIGTMSPLDLRNSYPISKILCESLCCAYAYEYKVPAMSIRLTQTFGAGVHYNDKRIFAYFAKCVAEKKNIVLKTKGETERCYLYTTDAVTAIFTILLKGKPGNAYNAADETTYCSIAEIAKRVAESGGIEVEFDIQDEDTNGFPQTLYMYLDTSPLKRLGWYPLGGRTIEEMFERTIADLIY